MDLDAKHMLNDDPNVTLTIRLIMQGKVSSTPIEVIFQSTPKITYVVVLTLVYMSGNCTRLYLNTYVIVYLSV